MPFAEHVQQISNGQILYRFHDTGKGTDIFRTEFAYANGNAVGQTGNTKDTSGKYETLLDTGKYNLVQPFDKDFPDSVVSSYDVRRGDTLQSIAAVVYGNPSLWFVLAEANGIEPGAELKEGQRLKIPNTVKSGRLTADTHKVYDEADIVGSTLPNLKSKKKDGGCGSILAIIIVIIIAVIAVYAVAFLASGFAGLMGGATFAEGVAAGVGVASIGNLVAAGIIVGAVASVVQQGVFMALGYQESFSWKAVAAGAVSGAFMGAARGIAGLGEIGKVNTFGSVQHAKVAAAALKVLGTASKQVIENGKITSWSSLAVAALAPTKTLSKISELVSLPGEEVLDYISPWMDLTETYVREGELTSADWVTAVGSTFRTYLTEPVDTSAPSFDTMLDNSVKNLMIGGALSAFDKDAALSFIENSVGNELGQFIGGSIVQGLEGLTAGLKGGPERSPDFRGDLKRGVLVGADGQTQPWLGALDGFGPLPPGAGDLPEEQALPAWLKGVAARGVFLDSIAAEQEQSGINVVKELIQTFFDEYKQDLDLQRAELAPNSTLENVGIGLKNFAVGIWETVETAATIYSAYQQEKYDLINDVGKGVLAGGDFSALEARKQRYIAAGEKGIDLTKKTAEMVSLVMGNEELRDVVTRNVKEIFGDINAAQVTVFAGEVLGDALLTAVTAGAGVAVKGARSGETALKLIDKLSDFARVSRLANEVGAVGPDIGYLTQAQSRATQRSIAAANIREARNILRDASVPLNNRNEIIRSFDLESFRIERVVSERTEFRVFDDFSARLEGRYVSPDFFANQTDRITKMALPSNSATRLGRVTIPSDSVVFTGRVAPQPNFSLGLTGGARQTFLTGPLGNYRFEEILWPR